MQKYASRLSFSLSLALIGACCAPSLRAQVVLGNSQSSASQPSQVPDDNMPINPAPPKGISPQDIIQKFAAKELEFKEARDHYTWTQDVKIDTLEGNTVDGEFREVTDIVYDDKGRRIENVTFAPQSTLQRVGMTKEDIDDIRNKFPFSLTTPELPKYQILYVGQQKVDELDTYVFDVAPKTMEKGQRYFQGRIWVDNQDLQIVKTYGKSVPDIGVDPTKKHKHPENENLFPRFVTYREQIDGKYWFPTYTKADDMLHFSNDEVHIRIIVKYSNYRRFGSDVKILYGGADITNTPDPSKPANGDKKTTTPKPQ